jgi:hypothetical protein
MAKSKHAKPLLAAAVICEKVVTDKENVATLVRIVDTLNVVPLDAPVAGSAVTTPLMSISPLALFISFKSGDAKGKRHLEVFAISPGGKKERIAESDTFFIGQEQGVNVTLHLAPPLGDPGLHWFDVRLDGALMAKVPLRVNHLKPSTSTDGTDEANTMHREKKGARQDG